jgi:hypothetical protein
VEWLSNQPSVHWIELAGVARLHNWQGTAVVQSATAAPGAPTELSQDQGTHPIWAAGLTGSGQTIGGGDSGMGETLRISSGFSMLCSIGEAGWALTSDALDWPLCKSFFFFFFLQLVRRIYKSWFTSRII